MIDRTQAYKDDQGRRCRKLWAHVLMRAIEDATNPDHGAHKTKAREWLLGRSDGITEVCQMLGVPYSRLMREIKRIIEDVSYGALRRCTWAEYMRQRYPTGVVDGGVGS